MSSEHVERTAEGAAEGAFETYVQRLESVVDELNDDALSLDAALRLFEEGISLLRQASEALSGAEGRVTLLVEQADGVLETKPFHSE